MNNAPISEQPDAVREPGALRLGSKVLAVTEFSIMAIVNRTPDSFYAPGKTWDHTAALEYVDEAVAAGADIVDVGGVPAHPGDEVETVEEIRRTAPFIAALRSTHPDLVISIDTWRHEVGREACAAGANLVNDSWGGWDRQLVEVAAEFRSGYVCTHVGSQPPRTRPFRVTYQDIMREVIEKTLGLADMAIHLGVDPSSILIDPAHDFGKNTWQSMEITRRLNEMVATGWPVLVSVSDKDFIGETLDASDPEERLNGTLAAISICAWQGARVFRVHAIPEAVQVLKMVSTMRGDLSPEGIIRGEV